jgi:hypothetical protein
VRERLDTRDVRDFVPGREVGEANVCVCLEVRGVETDSFSTRVCQDLYFQRERKEW